MAIYSKLKTIASLIKRVISRGVFLLHYARQNGVLFTLIKVYQAIKLKDGRQFIRHFNNWLGRNEIRQSSARGAAIFGRPSILIVGVSDLPQCKKYRLKQKIELFEQLGLYSQYADYHDTCRVLNKLQLATHLLLYRLPANDLVSSYIDEATRLGVVLCYDIDDPIFDEQVYRKNTNLDALSSSEKNMLLQSCAGYLSAMKQCEIHFVSTPGMAALERQLGFNNVTVWPNVIDAETLSIVNSIEPGDINGRDRIVLGYMSGSRAHDRDFQVVAEALKTIMQKHHHVTLVMGGYYVLPELLAEFSDRVKRLPFVGYRGYYANLSTIDINIVPLELGEFNECKSAIRYLEASVLKKPTVASAVGDFINVIQHNTSGLLAATTEEWVDAMDKLITDSEFRNRIADQAFCHVMKSHTMQALQSRMKPKFAQQFAVAT